MLANKSSEIWPPRSLFVFRCLPSCPLGPKSQPPWTPNSFLQGPRSPTPRGLAHTGSFVWKHFSFADVLKGPALHVCPCYALSWAPETQR